MEEAVTEAVREDATVTPALSAARYLEIGALIFSRSSGALGWRALRHASTVFSAGLPALLGGVFLWLLSLDPARRAATVGDAPIDNMLAVFESALPALSAPLGLVVLLVMLGLRGATQALGFEHLRAAVEQRPPDATSALRRSWAGFFGLSLVQAGLAIGALMFTTPLLAAAARVSAERSGDPGSALFVLLVLGIVVVALGALRFFTMLAEAHLVWRPRFFAGTVVAAISAPVTHFRLHARLLALWAFGQSLVTAVGATFGTLAVACWVDRALIPGPAWGGLVATGVVGFVLSAWFDAALVGCVAHRLGDHSAAELSGRRGGLAQAALQPGFEPPIPGIWRAGGAPARFADWSEPSVGQAE